MSPGIGLMKRRLEKEKDAIALAVSGIAKKYDVVPDMILVAATFGKGAICSPLCSGQCPRVCMLHLDRPLELRETVLPFDNTFWKALTDCP